MDNLVEMKGIYKTFPNNIRALRNANLKLRKGEIHSIVGENAAGKTTLMNVLYGIVRPDSGEIFINDIKQEISHPEDAIKAGIGMVHQHFKLVPGFSVLENIVLGKERDYIKRGWRVDYEKAEIAIEEILDRIHIDLDLDERTESLSIGVQQKVEIVKALFMGAIILILDEPTTVLAPNEVSSFLSFLKDLREQGCTVVYISHRLKEVFSISDRITVMRHGETIKTVSTDETTMETISSLMVGEDIKKLIVPVTRASLDFQDEALRIKNLKIKDNSSVLSIVDLTIRQGEIVGIAGVEGNGQVELADSIIGLQTDIEGEIYFREKLINKKGTYQRRRLGIRYVPDDRIKKGLALDASMNENAIMGYHKDSSFCKRRFFLNWKKSKTFTTDIVQNFRVEGMNNPEDQVQNLSGGNMQKLIIGREMISKPHFLILAQPTVGLDFGAQAYIHRKIREMSEEGTAFIVISEDLDELMGLSDRILCLYRGRITGEFFASEGYDEREIGYHMTGVKGDEE